MDDRVRQECVDPAAEQDADLLRVHAVLRPVDIVNYDPRIKQPVNIYPDPNEYASVKEVETTFTFLATTSYMSGRLVPQLVVVYDVRGAWMFQPQINFLQEPFRFLIQYSGIYGSFTNFGFFRDRDQISFVVSYLLN